MSNTDRQVLAAAALQVAGSECLRSVLKRNSPLQRLLYFWLPKTQSNGCPSMFDARAACRAFSSDALVRVAGQLRSAG